MSGHRAIRRSCKTCSHKPAQLRANPSLHNHHGICSFRRYHKSYCRKTSCGCQRGVTKTYSPITSRSRTKTKRKTLVSRNKSGKCPKGTKLIARKWNPTTLQAQYRRGDLTYSTYQRLKARKRVCK